MHHSFDSFNDYEQDDFSFALHYSADCERNRNWFEIFLMEKEKRNVKGGNVLGPAFDRILTKDKGCWVEDLEGSNLHR